jgi:hypothetical protein
MLYPELPNLIKASCSFSDKTKNNLKSKISIL